MNAQNAIAILAGAVSGDVDEARTALAAAVTLESKVGDPDDSIMDWIANGSYSGGETVESLAVEWDSNRE